MFDKSYDVFIAYHGSYAKNGSINVAEQLYSYLVGHGLTAYFYPHAKKDAYKTNIIDVMMAKTFILVSNENIATTDNKRLDATHHYELSTEIDAFYALTQSGDDVSVQDAKVLVCGDYFDKRRKGDEAMLHELFANRTHQFYEEQDSDKTFQELYEWIKDRLSRRVSKQVWQQSQVSHEVQEVLAKRSSMTQYCNLIDKIAQAM